MNELKTHHTTDHELLAIVNEYDEVVGSKPRREVHSEGLRHRAVHILVFDHEGSVCLQKRSKDKDVNPGAWDTSAAGHVDFGETYEGAAVRELNEELGITPDGSLALIGQIEACELTGWEFVQIFALRTTRDLTPNSEEIETLEWVSLEALERLFDDETVPLTRSFRRVWEKFMASELSPAFLSQGFDESKVGFSRGPECKG